MHDSFSDLTYMINHNLPQPTRMGALVSFPNFPALSRGFEKVTSMLPLFEADEYRQRYGYNNQPPNIMNLALRIFDKKDDMTEEAWSEKITALINQRRESLNKRGIRCVSVLICRQGQYLFFYTLRESNSVWGEEQAIRNIEPALAFQLEPSCLSNYKLTPSGSRSRFISTMPSRAKISLMTDSSFEHSFGPVVCAEL
jgi:acetyl-CoA carboxylase/biotin carboxylase 1